MYKVGEGNFVVYMNQQMYDEFNRLLEEELKKMLAGYESKLEKQTKGRSKQNRR